MANARKAAVRLLTKLDENSAYSNILLETQLDKYKFDERDKHFATALFYGCIERQLTLDRIIDSRLVRRSDKLSNEVRNILRTGIYQLLYMDSVPDHTAVDESVKLVNTKKNPALPGFVNGLLRSFVRDGKPLPEGKTESEKLSIEYSCPLWLVDKWVREYGMDIAQQMLRTSTGRPPVMVRVNTTKTTADKLYEQLKAEGVECEVMSFPTGCVKILGGSPEKTLAYRQGLFHVQDISSQLCCKALDPQAGMIMLDICSAPGGKSFTSAELMENKGRLLSFDLHENRVRLIRNGAARLGLGMIEASPNDAKKYKEDMPLADRVLCDVPCSGLGVIRRKPEIKYKDPAEFERLPEIQFAILSTSSRYVKEGGVLVYSTCTLSRAENDEVIDRFLSENNDFSPCPIGGVFGDEYKASITPERFGSDGFFIAKLMRNDHK